MAMFDKTFPTLDCAACILTPKMVSVGQHEMIRLLTNPKYSQLPVNQEHTGKDTASARYVDMNACVACNQCAEVCPVKVESEFDAGISRNGKPFISLSHRLFPMLIWLMETNCTYIQSEGKNVVFA